MKLRKVKKDGINEVGCLVVDELGVPNDRICRYTLVELAGKADSTQENITRQIIYIERWAEDRNINLEYEIATTGLSRGELFTSLIHHLERYVEKLGNEKKVTPIFRRTVEPEYFNQRIDACVDYFEYLFGRAVGRRRVSDPMIKVIKDNRTKLVDRLKGRKLRAPKGSSVHGLSQIQQASLYKGLEDPKHFGWNESTGLRNKLIVRLLSETGIRRGELLSLTIENCYTTKLAHGETPHIRTVQNVKYEDPRTHVPHEKTEGRVIPISHSLADLINEYKVVRGLNSAARRQPPFLILSSHSPYSPLSLSALMSIFEKIKRKIPGLENFGPHRLRHTFFENLDRMMHQNNYSDEEKRKIKNALGGWSSSSRQSENYETLATVEQCSEALKIYHDEIERI